MATILVTGASGFVGYHLVATLSSAGYAVRCLVRRHSRLDLIKPFGPELAYGDVTEPRTLAPALVGIDAVIHCAGLTRARRSTEFFAVNAEGTRHLCVACTQLERPPRLLVIGSLAALGPASAADAPVVEDDPPKPVGPYGESKLAGQQIAASFRDRLAVTILMPPAIYGPADADFLTCFRSIKRGFIPVIGSTPRWLSLLNAADLARAVVLCLEKPASAQQNYLVEDGTPHSWDEVTATIGRVMDRVPRTVRLPEAAAWAAAWAGGLWGLAAGRPPVLNVARMREFAHPCWVCSARRLREELGFVAQYDLLAGVRATHDWYVSRGWL